MTSDPTAETKTAEVREKAIESALRLKCVAREIEEWESAERLRRLTGNDAYQIIGDIQDALLADPDELDESEYDELIVAAGLVVVTTEATAESEKMLAIQAAWRDLHRGSFEDQQAAWERMSKLLSASGVSRFSPTPQAPEATAEEVSEHIRVNGWSASDWTFAEDDAARALLRDFIISPRVTGTGKDN